MSTSPNSTATPRTGDDRPPLRTVAAIDIGANSVRVNVAEIAADAPPHSLVELTQPASLGEDVFEGGVIRADTIKRVATILKQFRDVLTEYGVTKPDQIRAVATSAVREARNRETFIDRIYMATGIDVDVIDEAEETRLTYQSIMPYLDKKPLAGKRHTIVAEVGGGNTEIIFLRNTDVLFSQNYRLGSLRLREMLMQHHVPEGRQRALMESQIDRTIALMADDIPFADKPKIVALGSEMRFAAARLLPEWQTETIMPLPVSALAGLVDDVLNQTADQLVRKYRLTYPEAGTLGPTLLTYLKLCRSCCARRLFVTKATMRDGLLADLVSANSWSDAFFAQIVSSAIELGRKYEFDHPHARHVAHLAGQLFAALQSEHQLSSRYGKLLHIAALLHEIGSYVRATGHHKHSMYLIMNSELFGLGKRDLLITALIARYHRRAMPAPTHEGYNLLTRDERLCIAKLAAMLRVADALDRAHSQRIKSIACEREDDQLLIKIVGVDDLGVETLALRQKGAMFESVYGLVVQLQTVKNPLDAGGLT